MIDGSPCHSLIKSIFTSSHTCPNFLCQTDKHGKADWFGSPTKFLQATGRLCPAAPLPQHGGGRTGLRRAPTRGWYRAGAAPPGTSPLSSPVLPVRLSPLEPSPKTPVHPPGCGQGSNTAVLLGLPPAPQRRPIDYKPTRSPAGEQKGAPHRHSPSRSPPSPDHRHSPPRGSQSPAPAQPVPGIPEPRTGTARPGDPRAPHRHSPSRGSQSPAPAQPAPGIPEPRSPAQPAPGIPEPRSPAQPAPGIPEPRTGTARPGDPRAPITGTARPGDPRAPHRHSPSRGSQSPAPGTPSPAHRQSPGPRGALQRAHGAESAAGPPALPRRLPGAAPSPGPPAAFTCGESAGRAGSAPRRLPGWGAVPSGGSRDGAKLPCGRGHGAGGPGWRARSGAAPRIPRGTRPGQAGGRRGEAGAGPAPRPVPCPGSAAAATASEGRARRARRQLPPPPRGHRRAARRGSRSAPSSRPPRAAAALSRRQPPRVGGGFSLPPFPLSAHSSGSFLLPRSLPPLQPEPFSWTALPGSANRRRAPSPARPAEVRSREPPTLPGGRGCSRDSDLAHSAAPERGRRGAGESPLRPLPARGSGAAHPTATAGLQGRKPAQPPDGCSTESFPADWKGKMGGAASTSAVTEPGLRHCQSGTGSICILTQKWYHHNSLSRNLS
ncbi:basic proline-rich protein-like [Corvus cornix cornix]|uniref:basic proline-rich protein-like n=1 Tax=Corvus cornix cornix TaxID=932674 RepID=UPI00194E871B|nr:basic proline-rich protein-like [Corvus cornix cornix]